MEETTNSPVCRIEMLGGLAIYVGERLMPPLPKRISSVIAYIALRLERGATREVLIEQFWPESDPHSQLCEQSGSLDKGHPAAESDLPLPDWQKNGRNSLSNALSEVRKHLKVTGIAPDLLIYADRYEVRLNRDCVTTDVLEFEAMLGAARNTGNDKGEALRLIADAAELYRGPLLNGCDDFWIEGERQRLKDLFIAGARHLVRDRVECKDLRSAIEYARRAVNEGPDAEGPYFDLIQLLMHTKQFGAARKLYYEMDQAVGPVSNKAALLLPKIEAELEAQRSRARSGLAEDVGGEASHGIDTIPIVWTRFIGRNAALHDLTELLTEPHSHLVTIFGMGGSGKTRLALELASRLQARFSGQVWFVPLVNVTDPVLLPRAIADALHLPPADSEDPLAQAIEHLSRQEALLILDNFEHLIESGSAVIARLIASLPGVKLLVTSRRLVDLAAEHAFGLALMEVPGEKSPFSAIQQCESVQLFIDRARSRQPGYSLTDNNAGAIAALCIRLEGIPLAIELAAARIQVLTPEQMILQLRDRFRLLTTNRRDVDERHRSLLATLDWSFRLLDPELRECLKRLSVFRGGWTIEAAAAVNQADALEQLMLLQQLHECSLLHTEQLDDHVRFHMLETVRQFAALNLDQHETLQQLHLDYFLEFAEGIEPQLERVDAIVAIERLDVDIENIRAALAHGSSDSCSLEKALRLATVLYLYWKHRGLYREGRRRLEYATRDDIPVTKQVRAEALHNAGRLALLQGDYPSAAALLGTCLELRRILDNARKTAATMVNLGVASFHLQEDDRASALLEESAAIQRELQDWQNLAQTLIWQANMAHRRGDLEAAQCLLNESLRYYDQVGSAEGYVFVLNNLGALAHDQGNAEHALECYEECLSMHRKAGNRAEIARTLNNYGNALRDLGRLPEAIDALTESLTLWQTLENDAEAALTLVTLGITQCAQNNLRAAQESYSSSWQLSLAHNDQKGQIYVIVGMADVAVNADLPVKAAVLLAQAQRSLDEHSIDFFTSDRRDWDRILTKVQSGLQENEFDEAWRSGYAMPPSQSFPTVDLPLHHEAGLRP